MTGELPPFPSSMSRLHLGFPAYPGGNLFTGVVDLNAPEELYINDNFITDVIVHDLSAFLVNNCDLSNNPLLDSVNIVNLTFCVKNGLYSASRLSMSGKSSILNTKTSNLASITHQATHILPVSFIFSLATTSNVSPVKLLEHTFTTLELTKMGLKLLLYILVILLVLIKTPWRREWKSKIEKWRNKAKSVDHGI